MVPDIALYLHEKEKVPPLEYHLIVEKALSEYIASDFMIICILVPNVVQNWSNWE